MLGHCHSKYMEADVYCVYAVNVFDNYPSCLLIIALIGLLVEL